MSRGYAGLLALLGMFALENGVRAAAPVGSGPPTRPVGSRPAETGASTPASTSPPAALPAASTPDAASPDMASPDTPPKDAASEDTGPSEHSSVSLSRTGADGKQRLITVTRTGDSDDTGIFAICSPTESDPPTTPTVFVTSESTAGGIELSVDKNLIRAPLAVITKQAAGGANSGGPTGDGHIEVSAGTARYLDSVPAGKTDRLSLCAVEVTPKSAPGTVSVTQGRTTLQGQALVYDESDGIVRIAGPITFERQSSGDNKAGALSGSSDSIEVNIDHETTTLVGHVTLRSAGRVSTAQRVDYDDQASTAVLYGTPQQPATVQDAGGTVQASRIRYNLNTGRVSAQDITGQFEIEDGEGRAP